MFLVIGTVTADILVFNNTPLSTLGGDGFRSSNLVFTEEPVNVTLGGNGGNSAYALAGLGVPVALGGAVGQDLLGEALVNWLEARQVNLAGLLRSDTHATSSSTILVSDAANQVVFHHLGSTAQIALDHMPATWFDEAAVLLASSYPILPRWRTGGFATALSRVHSNGGITALDIGPAIGEPVSLAELTPLLPVVDYLIGNTHELAALTGDNDWTKSVRQLLLSGAQQVVIKQGAQGAAVWTSQEQIHVPAFPVAAALSVGAGDAFNAGFLYGLHQGWSWTEALRFGHAVAALVVSNPQGVLGAPTLSQVQAFLAAQAN